MRYWWVSQNATFKHELDGGYLWSPKENKNHQSLQYYDNMRLIRDGDPIVSYVKGRVVAVSTAVGEAYSAPKPDEFGSAGNEWSNEGWRVDADYRSLKEEISPKEHLKSIKPLLPDKYSPLKSDGNGNQAYLFEIGKELFEFLMGLCNNQFSGDFIDEVQEAEITQEIKIYLSNITDEVERETTGIGIKKSRKGQGLFKSRVKNVEQSCRVTSAIGQPLQASHIKPWSKSNCIEKLDGNNGLLLSPHIHWLFDQGYISFTDEGELKISKCCDPNILKAWGIHEKNTGTFKNEQKIYLNYHRDNIFKG